MRSIARHGLVVSLLLPIVAPLRAQQSVAVTASNEAGESVLSRPATFRARDIGLVAALTGLSESSGVALAFSPTLLRGRERKVSCECASVTVGEALDHLLEATDLRYAVLDGQVVVTPKLGLGPAIEPRLAITYARAEVRTAPSVGLGQDGADLVAIPGRRVRLDRGTVQGRVVDAESDRPLEGATVSLLNTPARTTTGADGTYRLAEILPGQYTLEAVRIGYARQTAAVTITAGEVTTRDIRLSPGSTRLNDLVVTAEKEEQNVQEIPGAVSVITPEQAERANLKKPTDLNGYLPNLVQSYFGTAGSTFTSIRGINGAASSSQFENAIATYVDGIYLPDAGSINVQFGDIERIEVLRGPQGTLYGRGAMGGVVNIITRQPTNEKRARLSAEFGNHGQIRYLAGGSGPLVRDQLFVSAEALYSRQSGIYTNNSFDGTWDLAETIGGTLRFKYVPSSRWSFGLNGNLQWSDRTGSYAFQANKATALANPYVVNMGPSHNAEGHTVGGFSFDARYFGSGIEVTSLTALHHTGRWIDDLDADFTPQHLLASTYGRPGFSERGWRYRAVSEEVRIGSRRGSASPLQWTLGGMLFRDRLPFFVEIFFDQSISGAGADVRQQTEQHREVDGSAFFGQVTYTIDRRVDLIAGLRREERTGESSQQSNRVITGGQTVVGPTARGSSSSSAWSPKVGVAYRPSDQLTLYGLVARGFRAGGFNFAAAAVSQPREFKPEYTTNYELGVKASAANGRVRANLTGFHIKWTDQQVQMYDLATFAGVTLNTGKATSQGVELELSALPNRYLQLDWNFGYNDATYDALNLSLDPNAPLRLDGNHLVFVPKFTSAVAAQLDVPIGDGKTLGFRGEWRALGKQFFDLQNQISQDGYSLLGARATLGWGKWNLAVWGRNLTDKVYLQYGFPFGIPWVLLGEPRMVGVTLSTRVWD